MLGENVVADDGDWRLKVGASYGVVWLIPKLIGPNVASSFKLVGSPGFAACILDASYGLAWLIR